MEYAKDQNAETYFIYNVDAFVLLQNIITEQVYYAIFSTTVDAFSEIRDSVCNASGCPLYIAEGLAKTYNTSFTNSTYDGALYIANGRIILDASSTITGSLWLDSSVPFGEVQESGAYILDSKTALYFKGATSGGSGDLKSDGSIPMDAGYTPANPKDIVTLESVIQVKGTVTAIDDITTAGIYDGVDLLDSPVQGPVIIEVYADTAGNLDISLKGNDGERHEGGRPNGGAVFWHNVAPDHLAGHTDPLDTLGNDGDVFFLLSTP